MKENFNSMGEYFIENNIYDTKEINKLLKTDVPKPCSNYIKEINSLISSLCIYNSCFNKTIPITLSNAAIYSFLKNLNPHLSSNKILDIIKRLKSNSI